MKQIYENPEMNIRTFKQELISTDENAGAFVTASQYTPDQTTVAEKLGSAAQKASYIFSFD